MHQRIQTSCQSIQPNDLIHLQIDKRAQTIFLIAHKITELPRKTVKLT